MEVVVETPDSEDRPVATELMLSLESLLASRSSEDDGVSEGLLGGEAGEAGEGSDVILLGGRLGALSDCDVGGRDGSGGLTGPLVVVVVVVAASWSPSG
ncbi:hypothetical protein Tdes44962_MAKER09811 [Teratosphaeria destructans]|uniref:Uncharacterized protein n=1 Tax=Teratosphaeria destructans TaxID=418781 RepID=A0A9W7W1V1_9PEZI|nr:hypothetical protein Tdes44962_MAKER09811 [Teratosphaeria destructans]